MAEIPNLSSAPCAVLIDDNPVVRTAWEARAHNVGKHLWAFGTAREFHAVEASVPRDCPIFIDSNLGDEERGEEVAQELSGRGFQTLYLVTGYPASYFGEMPWLKGILDKEPPPWLFSPSTAP